jgi:hypothetical protein
MTTAKTIPAELLEQLRRDRERIAAELPELLERGQRLDEAAAENSSAVTCAAPCTAADGL